MLHSTWVLFNLVVCTVAATVYNESVALEEEKVRYDNYKVYQIKLQNVTQLSLIDPLRERYEEYDFWKEYNYITKDVHIMVAPQEALSFQQFLEFNGLEYKLLINNVQDLIDRENSNLLLRAGKPKAYDWTIYHKWSEMEKWMDGILKSYPTVTSGFLVGKTYEKRKIRGIKISYKSGNPGIFIESTIHAREWIAPATATWFINALLTSQDEIIRNLAENYDWYILPVLNVDGYVYTHKKNRLWRKTRKPIKSSKCVGADANRNFDFYWKQNAPAAASDPCSDIYAGSKAFSEPETAALSTYLTSIKDKIKIYLALHSFGQFLFSPYSFSKAQIPANNEDLKQISKAFVDAVAALPSKTRYAAGSAAALLYAAGGTSSDWVFNKLNVKVSYTIEFRDLGIYGFDLPVEQMLANYNEFMAGVIALVKKAKELKYV